MVRGAGTDHKIAVTLGQSGNLVSERLHKPTILARAASLAVPVVAGNAQSHGEPYRRHERSDQFIDTLYGR